MDKFKGMAKGGWHPSGDKAIHRDSWKSDLKGMATNRKKDPYEEQRNHQSAPLTTLKDPDSFGPPPRHSQWYGTNGGAASPAGASASGGGLGSAVPRPVARIPTREERAAQEEEEKPKPTGPYRADTTGLNTTNLPKPPVRRADGASPAPPPRSAASPPVPPRQAQPPAAAARGAPAPVLPPRQNEYPDEYTAPPPPTYQEATVQPAVQAQPFPQARAESQNPATINGVAVNRLAQAGVNVPGFGIGGNSASQATPPQSPSTQGHPSQLSELQQRFSRMGTGGAAPASTGQASPPPTPTSSNLAAVAQKKPPPPPPPKKAGLGGNQQGSEGGAAPPPLPLSSKPRPS